MLPRKWKKVCILGVGLLGGSISKAMKARALANHVVGWGRSVDRLDPALAASIVDEISSDISQAAEGCDLVVAATPIQQIVPSLLAAAAVAAPECLFLDVGSTKATVAVESEKHPFATNFCPSHPIAGSEKSGWEFASPDLFEQKCVVITPSARTSAKTLEDARLLWESLGGKVVQMSPQEHDLALASTSHMPHLLASVLAAVTPPELLDLVGTGWMDTTRVAGGSPELWRQIIAENADCSLQAMQKFATIWHRAMNAIEKRDFDALHMILSEGKQIRDALGNRYSSCE
jgi:prephenate dehydrogenase